MKVAFVGGMIVPGMPQILLCPDRNPSWQALHDSFVQLQKVIHDLDPDMLLLYSTQWPSIIGHQIQANPNPKWTLVDQNFHDLGTLKYSLRIDTEFADNYQQTAQSRGLTARTVNYTGFPIDTGSVVVLQLLNPNNEIPACIVSCNMYADRAETIVLGKAAKDATVKLGRRPLAIAITALSNRQWTTKIDPLEDRIHSRKDDEWNLKLLDLLEEGRLEDVGQLARQFSFQANGDNKLKAIWWLAACLGQHNNYKGKVHNYKPVWGTGAALVTLVPDNTGSTCLEYDEDDIETYVGDRNVLSNNT